MPPTGSTRTLRLSTANTMSCRNKSARAPAITARFVDVDIRELSDEGLEVLDTLVELRLSVAEESLALFVLADLARWMPPAIFSGNCRVKTTFTERSVSLLSLGTVTLDLGLGRESSIMGSRESKAPLSLFTFTLHYFSLTGSRGISQFYILRSNVCTVVLPRSPTPQQ